MALNLTAATAVLKDDYQPMIRDQLNRNVMMLNTLEKNTEDVSGKNAVLALHTSRNSGVGARGENGTLPTAGNQGYREERTPMKYNYGRIQISGPTIAAMRDDKGAYIRAVESETKGVVDDLQRDMNRQVYNDATQSIAQAGVTAASTTVVLDTDTGAQALRQFSVDMVVDIGTVANHTAVKAGAVISAIDRVAKTITIDTAATTTAAHYVFRAGTTDNDELTGIREIIDNQGTLFNVDPTVDPVWKSTVNDNSGTPRTPTEALLTRVVEDIEVESGVSPNMIVSGYGARRAYAATLTSQKRFNDTTKLKGGYSALTVDAGATSLALVQERDAPEDQMFVLNTDHLQVYEMSDWEFMDDDGAVLNRVPNTDAYEATLYKYCELVTDSRVKHGVIRDLSVA